MENRWQWSALADADDVCADRHAHLATPQCVQFHHVPLDCIPEIIRRVGDVGLTTRARIGWLIDSPPCPCRAPHQRPRDGDASTAKASSRGKQPTAARVNGHHGGTEGSGPARRPPPPAPHGSSLPPRPSRNGIAPTYAKGVDLQTGRRGSCGGCDGRGVGGRRTDAGAKMTTSAAAPLPSAPPRGTVLSSVRHTRTARPPNGRPSVSATVEGGRDVPLRSPRGGGRALGRRGRMPASPRPIPPRALTQDEALVDPPLGRRTRTGCPSIGSGARLQGRARPIQPPTTGRPTR